MALDIRRRVGTADHPKIEKLVRRLGEGSYRCWDRLLEQTALHKPEGFWRGATPEDIEILARWTGEPGLFYQALVELRLGDQTAEGLGIHDWSDHQPFLVSSPKRRQVARQAAEARWASKQKKVSDTRAADCRRQTESEGEGEPRVQPNASRLPNDFELTPERMAAAREIGLLDVGSEFELFRDFWKQDASANARKADWDSAWKVWCRRSLNRRSPHTIRGGRPNTADAALETNRRLQQEALRSEAVKH